MFQEDIILRDEKFEVDQIGRYKLCFALTPTQCRLAVFDTKSDRCLCYERYTADIPFETDEQFLNAFSALVDTHSFASAGYWQKIALMMGGQEFTFVPDEFFRTEYALSYLRFNTTLDTSQSYVQFSEHQLAYTNCLFAMPKTVSDWIEEKYPHQKTGITYVHQTAAFLEGLLLQENKSNQIHALIEGNQLYVAVLDERNLLFLNRFEFKNAEEVAYFILAVSDDIKINSQKLEVILYGQINKEGKIFQLLDRYAYVKFASRPAHLTFGYQFDQLESHEDFDLFSLYYVKTV